MSDRGVEVKVGILVTVCAALLVAFIVLLGGGPGGGGAVIYLDVDTSSALKPGAPIKVAGVPAGEVVGVDYRASPGEGGDAGAFVRVTLSVDADKLTTLTREARFTITTQGLLGEKYVEIAPSALGEALREGDVVRGEPSMALDAMTANANRVLIAVADLIDRNEGDLDAIIGDAAATMTRVRHAAARADDLITRLDTLVGANEGDVATAIDELLVIEGEVKTLLRAANTALGDGTEVRRTIRRVRGVVDAVEAAVPAVVDEVRGTLGRYGELAGVASAALTDTQALAADTVASVDAILADVKVLTERLRDGEGTIGALLSDQEMYDDVREMMKDLKRHPWKFIWKE